MQDRTGNCPNCNASWVGGDILEVLSSMSIHSNKSVKDMEKVASLYGWTPHNNKKFSSVRVVETEDGTEFYQCSNMRCGYVVNAETGELFDSLVNAKRGISAVQLVGKSVNQMDDEKALEEDTDDDIAKWMKEMDDDNDDEEDDLDKQFEDMQNKF